MGNNQRFERLADIKIFSIGGGLALLLVAAIAAGGVAVLGRSSSNADSALTVSAMFGDDSSHEVSVEHETLAERETGAELEFGAESESAAETDLIALLHTELTEARAHGKTLEREIGRLKIAFSELEQRVAKLISERQVTDAEQSDRPTTAVVNSTRSAAVDSLVAAGFDIVEAEQLAQRWGEAEMEQLYLRDQAVREGWIDTPRYREAVNELQQTYSITNELDGEAYDRFLFATGQPNRVSVSGIIEGSPAQLVGLQPGDVIVSYDGTVVRSGSDLRGAISAGEIDDLVLIEVDRGGQPVSVELPRGPMGIRLESLSIAP